MTHITQEAKKTIRIQLLVLNATIKELKDIGGKYNAKSGECSYPMLSGGPALEENIKTSQAQLRDTVNAFAGTNFVFPDDVKKQAAYLLAQPV